MSRIKEISEKYDLKKDDFWELKRGGKSAWIITHDACQKIAFKEGVVFHPPNEKLSCTEPPNVRFVGEATLGDRTDWSTGESNPTNCKMPYMVAMAEKRLKDRLTLKLINAYEFGVYSEVESDDFSKPKEKAKQEHKIATTKQKDLIMGLELRADLKPNAHISFEGLTMLQASQYIDKLNNKIKEKVNNVR